MCEKLSGSPYFGVYMELFKKGVHLCIKRNASFIKKRGPVLFKQKRFGIHKRYFNIMKFRTMSVEAPKDMPTHLLENPEQHITNVGRFLRKTSLDELPQIINIFKG
jgi:lipopolysaccharide/colanic/teichoic acid biosynthesis glycosyltransferase